jgi:hypothetical protein
MFYRSAKNLDFYANSITDIIKISCIHVAKEKFIFLAEASQDWWLEPTTNLLEPAGTGSILLELAGAGWSQLEPAGASWSQLEPAGAIRPAPGRAGASWSWSWSWSRICVG